MKVFAGLFVVFLFICGVAVNVGLMWVGASAVTSGIKAITNNCDTTYTVEYLLEGDWFCPTRK